MPIINIQLHAIIDNPHPNTLCLRVVRIIKFLYASSTWTCSLPRTSLPKMIQHIAALDETTATAIHPRPHLHHQVHDGGPLDHVWAAARHTYGTSSIRVHPCPHQNQHPMLAGCAQPLMMLSDGPCQASSQVNQWARLQRFIPHTWLPRLIRHA